MTYEHVWTVRFSDTDPFGIAHYSRIVAAVHETADAFVADVGVPFWEMVDEHGLGLPLLELDLEFHRPLRAGDEVVVEVCTDLGERGVRFVYEARTADGEVAFEGFEQRACVPVGGESAVPIPDDLRTALATAACD